MTPRRGPRPHRRPAADGGAPQAGRPTWSSPMAGMGGGGTRATEGRRGAGRPTRDAMRCCPVVGRRSRLVLVEPLTAMGGVGGLPALSRPHLSPSRDTPVGARRHRCLWRGTGFCHRGLPAAHCIVCRDVARERGPGKPTDGNIGRAPRADLTAGPQPAPKTTAQRSDLRGRGRVQTCDRSGVRRALRVDSDPYQHQQERARPHHPHCGASVDCSSHHE